MRSLTLKLTLAFLIAGLTGAVLVALFVGFRTRSEFDRFVLDRYRVEVPVISSRLRPEVEFLARINQAILFSALGRL